MERLVAHVRDGKTYYDDDAYHVVETTVEQPTIDETTEDDLFIIEQLELSRN
jgi:hypothetical protein